VAELRILLVDDEPLVRRGLRDFLEGVPDAVVVGECGDGAEALAVLGREPVDVVFLDVQMPELDGIAVAGALAEQDGPAVVFVTAYSEHAVRAFELNAVDYLLKPVEVGRLEQALARVRRRLSFDRPGPLNDQLERIVKMMTNRQIRRDQVALKVGERFLLVQADEIIYASLADESINIVTAQVSGTSNYRTLDELQARLDPEVFWRVHRSHLVNINKIKEIVPWFSRNYILRMKDVKSTEIPVSRAQTRRLRQYLKL
jgi:two-component system LytT family response regulator/two-component system response regulator LytT